MLSVVFYTEEKKCTTHFPTVYNELKQDCTGIYGIHVYKYNVLFFSFLIISGLQVESVEDPAHG